jgi:hypothetical protein
MGSEQLLLIHVGFHNQDALTQFLFKFNQDFVEERTGFAPGGKKVNEGGSVDGQDFQKSFRASILW